MCRRRAVRLRSLRAGAARCATGAGRRSGAGAAATETRLSLSRARRATPSARSRRARFVPPSTRRASLRDVEETKLNPRRGKANRGADVSIAAHLLPPRSAPARRGARSAEAVVRASADMLAGNGGGEPRARSCASVWSQPRARKRFPLDARRTYRVSTRVFRGSQSQTSTSRSAIGDFLAIRSRHTSASFRHTPNSRTRGKHSFTKKTPSQVVALGFFRRTNERTIPLSLVVTPPPRTALHHHFTHGQKCWQSACASSAVTHEGARAGCW